ncbi:MAG: flagellar biosynthesis protein FliQ [Lachnospiraceae bacterium]|nr:flagellar biosynthesis protein FliQ [Lachnospiraceae bacterium]
MTVDIVMDIASEALFLILKISLPILLVSLALGLLVSVFQTITSIQEQTLTFVPKMVGIFLALILLGDWMMTQMVEFMEVLWGSFSLYIHR